MPVNKGPAAEDAMAETVAREYAVNVLGPARNPLASFQAALEAREMAPGSVRLYLSALRALEAQQGPLLEMTVDRIRVWFSAMKEAGLAAGTRTVRLAAAREFFSWAVTAGIMEISPFQGQKEFKIRRKDQGGTRAWRGMEKATLRALAAYLEGPLPGEERNARLPDGREVKMTGPMVEASEIRDRAVLWLLLATGLRAGEVAGLQVHDLSEEDGHIIGRVLGKGGKERPFVLGSAATVALRRWMAMRDLLVSAEFCIDGPVFVSDLGTAFHSKKVWLIVKRIAREAGVKQRLHPHAFRHARADELLEKSRGDLALVAENLGHASLDTTRGYLARNPKMMKARLAQIGGLE